MPYWMLPRLDKSCFEIHFNCRIIPENLFIINSEWNKVHSITSWQSYILFWKGRYKIPCDKSKVNVDVRATCCFVQRSNFCKLHGRSPVNTAKLTLAQFSRETCNRLNARLNLSWLTTFTLSANKALLTSLKGRTSLSFLRDASDLWEFRLQDVLQPPGSRE